MYYPILIHKDTDTCFGVTVPDLPGCYSAGDTLDDALKQAQEAIELHIEGLLEDNQTIPSPTSIDHHVQSPLPPGGTWALVRVDLDKFLGPAERINITVPRLALRKIDSAAARSGMNRSQFLVQAALAASSRP